MVRRDPKHSRRQPPPGQSSPPSPSASTPFGVGRHRGKEGKGNLTLLFTYFLTNYYHDALRHKNNQVALLLVECFGGIASGGARLLRYLARRASDKKRGRDGTKYSRTRPTSFLMHHMRQISSAAVITDACNIEKEIIGLKISQAPRGA